MGEPIAIIGLGLRFPGGVDSPEAFWRLLTEGRDAVTELQPDRWDIDRFYHPRPGMVGKAYTKAAGQLDDIWAFDANFFGISPREASQIDPQQRLLLEMTWEAFEDAGIAPSRLKGSDTGVFIGISSTDSAGDRFDDPASGNAYFMTGCTLSIAANRISYVFDLHGPSMAIDTACSSSLIALHQACQALWSGAAEQIVCGGVNVLLSPYPFVGFSQASMLSPDGRCKAFDANGRGYVRSEGGAVVLLKPLSRAKQEGDPVRAVIAGVGSNCDGRTAGISLANSATQQELLHRVYEDAGIDPALVSYIEMHGTGTAVGDPAEATAVGKAIGRRHSTDSPLLIGSVKTNIGHLESGSGMAGLSKAILCLQHRLVPPSLHFSTPNPNIPFQDLNLMVPTRVMALSNEAAPAVVGVNSFGFGGANAHVILREFQADHKGQKDSAGTPDISGYLVPLLLSARSEESLKGLVRRYRDLVASGREPYPEIARAAAFDREHHPIRIAVFGRNPEKVTESLNAFLDGTNGAGICHARCHPGEGRTVGVFSGNGAQWFGMGRCLFEADDVFRRWLERTDDTLSVLTGWSVVDEIFADEENMRLDKTEVAQPILFAVQIALWEMLRERGVRFAAVLGHSVGEVAAAYAAGILDLQSAALVIFQRSHFQGLTRGFGRMAAMGVSETVAAEETTEYDGRVEVAAINSPKAVTVTGPLDDLTALEERMAARNVFFRILDLDYAFHSRCMDPIEAELQAALKSLQPGPSQLRFVSTVTGVDLEGDELNARYWWNNVRRPVRFYDAVATLANDGYEVFLELGPHAILQYYLNETLRQMDSKAAVIAALEKSEPEDLGVVRTFGRLYTHGGDLDLERLYGGTPTLRVRLPTYPWHRERHHYEPTPESLRFLHGAREHPFLGWRRDSAAEEWEGLLDTALLPWLADHRVGGAVLFPAAGFIETALAASRALYGDAQPLEVGQLEILRPMELSENESRVISVTVKDGLGSFEINSRGYMEPDVQTTHVVGRLLRGTRRDLPAAAALPLSRTRSGVHLKGDEHYATARHMGLDYGASFRCVKDVWSHGEWAWAKLAMPPKETEAEGSYLLNPSLLDGCFQTLFAVLAQKGWREEGNLLLPTTIGHAVLLKPGSTPRFCATCLKRTSRRSVVAEFSLFAEDMTPVAQFTDCRFRRIDLRSGHALPGLYGIRPIVCDSLPNAISSSAPGDSRTLEDALKCAGVSIDSERTHRYQTHVVPRLNELVAAFAYQEVAPVFDADASIGLSQLCRRGNFVDGCEPLLRNLLAIGEENGFVTRSERGWRLTAGKEPEPAEKIWNELMRTQPEMLPEMVQVGRCGRNLGMVLRGELHPESVLNPKGSAVLPHLLDQSVSWEDIHTALGSAVAAYVRWWDAPRRMRVLHLGLGQPAFVRQLLLLLPQDGLDYVYASPNEAETTLIAGEFGTDSFVSTWEFDADALPDPTEKADSFDLVLAWDLSDWAHDVHDIIPWVSRMTTPEGLILLIGSEPTRMSQLVHGLRSTCEDAWSTENLARPRAITSSVWRSVLGDYGFGITELLSAAQMPLHNAFLLGAWRTELDNPVEMSLESKDARRSVLVVSGLATDGNERARLLVDALGTDGYPVQWAQVDDGRVPVGDEVIRLGGTGRDDFLKAFVELKQRGALPELVISLFALPGQEKLGTVDCNVNSPIVARRDCLSVLNLTQTIAEVYQGDPPQLVIVGSGALNRTGKSDVNALPSPSQWAVAGLRRVIANEHSSMRCRLIDWHADDLGNDSVPALVRELDADDAEDEIILVGQHRYGVRLRKLSSSDLPTPISAGQGKPLHYQLDFATPGSIDNLRWQVFEPESTGESEIVVDVRATGLNFRDVMWTMGLLQDEAVEDGFAGATLGMECAGVITEIGSRVSDFEVGNEVVCFAPSCFASRVKVNTTAVARKPENLSFAEAATIPAAFFTVYYALHHLAGLQPGENVLIHGAAGGVGLAAIQYARHVGAEIFATAGTPEKRDFLGLLGIDHVFDSRSLDFANEVLEATAGEGVDVVLNSLAGEAIERNLRILRPFGRFLELGKRDFYTDSKIGLRPFRNNISYFGVDADQIMARRPILARRLFQEMMNLFTEGSLRPLPHRVFAQSRVREAFLTMQQSRHIGKLVIVPGNPEIRLEQETQKPPAANIDADATYLVTGGLGGFGLVTARWLADKGARHLSVLGRSGAVSEEAGHTLTELENRGVAVQVLKADVTDCHQLQTALQQIRQTGRPLRGLVHAAMVLDDGVMQNLTEDRFSRVFDTKACGAWNLHSLTMKDPLDFFVMYSSATSCLGSAGQANYVAGNAYLEGLAEYRRSIDRPGLAVSWGSIGDVGVLARDDGLRKSLAARTGFRPLSSSRALDILDRLIGTGSTNCAVMDLDWSVIQRSLPGARAARFREVLASTKDTSLEDAISFRERIIGLDANELRTAVENALREQVGKVLRVPADKIDPDLSLQDMGMDSLMAVELALEIEKYFGIPFASMSAAAAGSVSGTAARIAATLSAKT